MVEPKPGKQKFNYGTDMKPENYDKIMSDGWVFQKEMYQEGKTIGWIFLSSLFNWANRNSMITQASNTAIEAEISRLERLFIDKRTNSEQSAQSILEAVKTNVTEDEKRNAAMVALSF